MSNVGCRIFTEIPRPDKELVERFRGLPVANIGDNMNRIYCVDPAIKSLNGRPLLGVAYTIHAPSGDNLFLHKALELAQPGDVIVIAAGGPERSYFGELMMMDAQNHGYAGVVVDGYARDLDGISKLDMPVYARGINPQGPYKNGPGEINVPIACGGQVVFPGDIVIGDEDGLIFVRPCDAEGILAKTVQQHAKEDGLAAAYEQGSTQPSYSPEIREQTLANLKVDVIEGCWEQ
ncbi:MAG: RraA family protein [Oscillospiraceae bacterium]|nr:RraA family protein [Oscillospiraceae bacterium]